MTMTETPHVRAVLIAGPTASGKSLLAVELAQTTGGVVICGTLQGVTGGTQTHSRRTGSKLGRLHRARQGLVRVPESNTKYGGKEGITGGCRACDRAQVSVSPRGFPSKKNLRCGAIFGFIPLFTGEVFFAGPGLLFWDSRSATEDSWLACPRARGRDVT